MIYVSVDNRFHNESGVDSALFKNHVVKVIRNSSFLVTQLAEARVWCEHD
jgi:hypothetical protein